MGRLALLFKLDIKHVTIAVAHIINLVRFRLAPYGIDIDISRA
jgi:hypothetical protein